MSRNAPPPSIPRRASQWASHLRQSSRSSTDPPSSSFDGPRSPDTTSSHSTIRESQPAWRFSSRICTVTINESINRDDILLNLDHFGGAVKPGMLMSITASKTDQERPQAGLFGTTRSISFQRLRDAEHANRTDADPDRKYIFIAKDMPKQLKASQPNVEVYVAKHIGDAFNMRRGTQVVLAPVDESSPATEASHVELTFKDMYLSRADMWRLAVTDLAERTVYKGQVLYFMGTIKAVVSTVFVDGRKVHSAFFGKETRPVFRSESARYVLFIQMAREMWDFDADGSGEILFYKVVNGFLPALFKKWAMMQVKHLVTIVLFARVEYDVGITADLANTSMHDYYTGFQTTGNKRPYKDFYRVVVSEMSSGEWTTILRVLKREHNSFRRDISIHHESVADQTIGIPEDIGNRGIASSRIRAESSLAMHGNFLEAINLASLVYSRDHIDRDLLRTGISVVVISPGSGVFEVEHEALRRSTEALISNGIGIDLICIGSIPLHSVPLFRYRNPHFNVQHHHRSLSRPLRSRDSTPRQPTPLASSYNTLSGSISPTKIGESSGKHTLAASRAQAEEWAFAIPQWLHVSYWTGKTEGALSYQGIALTTTGHDIAGSDEEFAVRCRLYDLQMRSVLDTNEIETPQLHTDPSFPNVLGTLESDRRAPESGASGSNGGTASKQYEVLVDHVYGFHKFNTEKMTKSAEAPLWKKLTQFDESRARLPASRTTTARLKVYADIEESTRKQLGEDAHLFGTSVNGRRSEFPATNLSSSVASSTKSRLGSLERSSSETLALFKPTSRRDSSATVQSKNLVPKTPKFIRQISLGHRGFGIAAPKAAIAELKTETVNATPTSASTADRIVRSPSTTTLPQMKTISRPGSPTRRTPAAAELSMAGSGLADSLEDLTSSTPSRPIFIKNSVSATEPIRTLKSTAEAPIARSARPDDRDIRSSHVLRAEDEQKLIYSKLRAGSLAELPSTLSPTTALAPWLVVLNPSNPEANKVDDSVLFSRWQHVFPRPSEMSVMKWKSLSSPAAVPLTTEYFPSKEQFDTEYQRQPYTISQNVDDDYGDETRSREDFLRELINARFAHGFQVVVGPSVAKAFGQKTVKATDVLSRDKPVEDGTSIFMSIGNTIHQLSCANGSEVDVNIYTRKPTATTQSSEVYRTYKPAIRTLYDPSYIAAERDIWSPPQERNWNFIDSFLAGHTEEMTENLRFWRARFVLIPMTAHGGPLPKEHKEPHGVDDDEEVRLEGIRKLSQLWLKHRYLPPSERQFQSGGDPNPLDIVYKTEDASTVIAAELESLPIFENTDPSTRKPHLVSRKERFSKTNFNLNSLTEAIQQPAEAGGIRMQTRRWHLQRYSNCFIGSEMTTWLLANFEDLENREEAVELGNSLMCCDDDRSRTKDKESLRDARKDRDRGIFVHVDRRHPFRDGQYFYRIVGDFAKPSVPGWFNTRKKDSSVPPTPVAENMPKDTPRLGFADQSRPAPIQEANSPMSGATTPTLHSTGMKRPRVMLSKMIKYDVDPRKKSYRPERINLHYDRLHNPDNCYHIRLEWVNVTAKLIEDTIKSWASLATQHGLRLVELPISEVTKIPEINPFRRPVRLKLAVPPPTQRPVTFYYPNTITPQQQPGKHYYQRALLRKFDYVLDYEAASAFPSNVSVSYSWGAPDHKYTQYVHRSGMFLAQISDEGDIHLAANRLYSNRTAAQQVHQGRGGADVQAQPPANERVARLMQSSAHSSYSGAMVEGTPISSPMFRPVLFASPGNRGQQYADMATTFGGGGGGSSSSGVASAAKPPPPPLPAQQQQQQPLSLSQSQSQSQSSHTVPTSGIYSDTHAEARINELARFCADAKALEAFYKETLEHGTQATPASVPATIPEEGEAALGESSFSSLDGGVADANIPALGLPPGVLDYGGFGGGGLLGGGGGGSLLSGGGGEGVAAGGGVGSRAGTPGSTHGGEPRSLFLRRASVQHN